MHDGCRGLPDSSLPSSLYMGYLGFRVDISGYIGRMYRGNGKENGSYYLGFRVLHYTREHIGVVVSSPYNAESSGKEDGKWNGDWSCIIKGVRSPKLLVSPLTTPIVVPYNIPYVTPFLEFRL